MSFIELTSAIHRTVEVLVALKPSLGLPTRFREYTWTLAMKSVTVSWVSSSGPTCGVWGGSLKNGRFRFRNGSVKETIALDFLGDSIRHDGVQVVCYSYEIWSQ